MPRRGQRAEPKHTPDSNDPYSRLSLQEFASPFEGLNRDQIDNVVANIGRECEQRYDLGMRQLAGEIYRTNPILLLANLAAYFHFHPEGEDPELTQDRPILPFHLEIVQAIALMRSRSEYGDEFPIDPALVARLWDTILEIAQAWAGTSLTRLAAAPIQQRPRQVAQARIRLHTAAIRNWGFPEQMTRIVLKLFEPLDDFIEQETSLRATSIYQMLLTVVSLIEQRFNDLLNRLRPVYAAATLDDAVDAYYTEFSDIGDDRQALLDILQHNDVGLQQAKVFFLLHRELSFPAIFTLTLDDFERSYPGAGSRQMLHGVIDTWTWSFGELSGRDPAHFFLDNPVWAKPFIHLDDGSYFCPNAGLLHTFGLEMIEGFLGSFPELVQRYETRRARFLETEVETLFRSHFPSATIVTGSKWRDPLKGIEGENDLLMVLDDYAVVVEAKAGKITAKALRGHPERLEKTVQCLVVEPTAQGRNFAELLLTNPGQHRFATERGVTNEIDSSEISQFVAVNVTFELFGLLALRWPTLQEGGLIPFEATPTVTLSLVDLEIILQVLDSEARRLHYLARRTDLETRRQFIGDELDLLAYYLKTGFNIGNLEFAENCGVDLGLQSKVIDLLVQDPSSPRLPEFTGMRLNRLWQNLLNDLTVQRPTGWVAASGRLFNVAFEEQQRAASILDELASKARRAPGPRAERQAGFSFGARDRRKELVVLVFKGFASEEAASRAVAVRSHVQRRRGIEDVIVVYLRIDDRTYACLPG